MYINFKCALTKAILFVFFAQIILFNHVAYAQTAGELQIKQPKFESNVLPEANTDFQINKPQFNKNQTDFSQPEFEIVKPELRNPEIKNPELKEPEVRESEENSEKEKKLYYIGLMRRVADLRKGEVENIKEEKELLAKDLEKFIEMEKENLEKLRIDDKKRQAYFDLLQKQIKNVEAVTPETIEEEKEKQKREAIKENRPENPSSFDFNDQKVKIDSINIEESKKLSYNDHFGESLNIKTAYAMDTQYMPVLEDIQESDEVVLSADIKALSDELNRNPVNILNYVHNNIDYEPYYGAKKGSEGCLREKICNDTDAASLTIALMRASGIPARYKKGVAVMSVEQLQELLAVDETKTVYYALYVNKVPVYTLGGTQVGQNIDAADFSGETHLAVEWTYPEIFYDYDEKGGNVPNQTKLEEIQTTQELRDLYTNKYNKNWIPVDGITKRYSRSQNTIVHDTVNFDTETFWYDYLQYQGALSPLEKYVQDIQNQSGNDITDPQFQSTKEIIQSEFDILPPSRPYGFASGVTNGGDPINIETWSQLPDDRRFKVEIKLLRDSDNSEVLSNTFFGNEINNKEVEIIYKGATPADQSTIDSYGGIHLTPASLVDIKPVFLTKDGRIENSNSVSIGEKLVLEFNYYIKGNVISTNQKFSVAGNEEGIYIVLSRTIDKEIYSDGIDDESQILLEGNSGIGWKYLKEVEKESKLIEKTLDYESNLHYLRAVVTNNRDLNKVGGVATTFDFVGLTMDASSYINDYSKRGNFKIHNEDFRMLWGLQASYYEGQIFNDLSVLDGISTVKGIQYAYANPSEYTMHIIDSGNQTIINSLNLSSNTKQNMLADVQAGNTIITPDKPVSMGEFTGVLYVSLDPEKTGNYAIGEQNGGWSVNSMSQSTYFDGMSVQTAYEYFGNNRYFLHEDKQGTVFNCNLTDQQKLSTINEALWQNSYGWPCYVPSVPSGQTAPYEYYGEHLSFKVATNATKFWRGGANGYTYWDYNDDIIQKLNDYANNNGMHNGHRVKFSHKMGTYKKYIYPASWSIYYSPQYEGGVKGRIYEAFQEYIYKLEDHNYDTQLYFCDINEPNCYKSRVYDYLGFPTGGVINTSTWSGLGYQDYIGGRIYSTFYSPTYDPNIHYFSETYYVPGIINDYHIDNGGYSGRFGFPIDDPIYHDNDNILYQDFEKGRINVINNVRTDGQIEHIIQAVYIQNNDEDYIEGFYDELTEDNIVGIAIDISAGIALSELYSKLLSKLSTSVFFKKILKKGAVKFVPLVGWAFLAYSVYMAGGSIIDLNEKCNSNLPYQGADPVYYCGKRDAVIVLVALGILGDQAAQSKIARNVFKVVGNKAKQVKSKLFSLLESYSPQKQYLETVSLNYRLNRSQFYENLHTIVNDETSLRRLLNDKDLMERMASEARSFYMRFRIDEIVDHSQANTYFPNYNNPYPYPHGSNAVRLRVGNAVTDQDLVRFHNTGNPTGPFLMRRDDIPYKSNGKIDIDRVKSMLNIPGNKQITIVSKYKPNTNDTLIAGKITGGDQDILQYGIQDWDGLYPHERELRFEEDGHLTNRLP
jgi:hypothetical protein